MSKQVSGGTRRPESSTINSVDDRPNRLRRDRSDRVQVGTGRRTVAQVSMLITPRWPTRKPVLLIHQVPSGWI